MANNTNNKTCVTCGKQYKYCSGCNKNNNSPTWMNLYCSSDCRTLFQTTTDYLAKEITKEQAFNAIKNIDVSKKSNLNKSVSAMVAELIAENKPSVKKEVVNTVEKKIEVKVEEKTEIKNEIKEEVVEPKKVTKRRGSTRKRNSEV